jgi:hypothetical protein
MNADEQEAAALALCVLECTGRPRIVPFGVFAARNSLALSLTPSAGDGAWPFVFSVDTWGERVLEGAVTSIGKIIVTTFAPGYWQDQLARLAKPHQKAKTIGARIIQGGKA